MSTSNVRDVWPVTPLQAGILFHSRWEAEVGERPTYQLQFGVEVSGPLPVDAVRPALADLLAAHENLSVAFPPAGLDRPVQVVPEHAEVPVRFTDIADIDDLDVLAHQEWDAGFDLTRPPLIRVLVAATPSGSTWLLVTAHHLVLDGWSVPLLLDELLSRVAGDAVPDPDVHYLDYLDHLDHLDLDAARAGLVAELDGVTDATLVAPADPGGAVTTAVLDLDADLSENLAATARALGVTPASIVQAAWAVVVGAASGRDDVVVGSVASGRDLEMAGIDRLVGLVSNTLPLRLRVPFTARLSDVVDEAHQWRATLLTASVADLGGVQADLGVAPLFDTVVVVENYPAGIDGWTSVDGHLRVVNHRAEDAVHYPLSLLAVLSDRWHLEVSTRRAAFKDRPEGWAIDQLAQVLTVLATEPDRPVATLDLRTVTSPGALTGGPPSSTGGAMLDDIQRVLDSRPDAVALVAGDVVWTVAELHARAAAVRTHLPTTGTPVVGLLLHRSADLVAAVLACLVGGATFVPLDPEQPGSRLAAMVQDAAVDLLVAAPEHAHLATRLHRTVLGTDMIGAPTPRPPRARSGAEPAYVAFTSGTTGRPKGCVNSLDGLANRIAWMAVRYGIGADDVVLHKTPVSFDVSVWELVLPLVTGARCVVVGPGLHRDPDVIDALVRENEVSVLHFVPSMLAALLDLVPAPVWPTVRTVLCSGEVLPTALAARARAAIVARVHNLYGPTEAAIDVTAGDDAHLAEPGGAPIGVAVPGVTLRVLDPWLRPVDVGATGELYLGGVQVGLGYAGHPGLTGERFVADPSGAGERLYRTGDHVVLTEHGPRYVGRADDQVKVHGVRIELGDIAATIRDLPGVRSAVADVVDGMLVGWAVTDLEADAPDLARDLAERLPATMRPSRLVVIDEIPTTTNGKVDRAALTALATALHGVTATSATSTDREPRTEAERVVTAATRAVLGLASVSPEADLFSLGLDSITAIGLVGRIRQGGWTTGLREVFSRRTLAAIAEGLAPVESPKARPATEITLDDALRARVQDVVGTSRTVERVLPLGPLQEGLYVHREMGGRADELDVYVVQHQLTVDTEVDAEALAAAGTALLRRHQSLRAGFTHLSFDRPVAVVVAPLPMPLEELDLTGLGPDEQAGALEALLARQVEDGFDLAAPPLIRLVLVRLGPARSRISLVHHHILTDGWSQTLVLDDLVRLYDRALSDPARPVSDAHLPPTADYATYLDWVATQDHAESMATWRAQLSGLAGPTLVAPRSLASPPVLSESADAVLSATLSDALRDLAASTGVTLSTVLSHAWAHVLRSMTGTDDVVFGTTVSGRPAELDRVDRMVGLLMNTIPVRVTIDPAARITDQLREQLAAQAAVMGAHHLGLGWIGQAAGHGTLFDTLYVFRNLPADQDEQEALFARHHITEAGARDGTHYSLAMTINPGRELEVALAYRPDLFDPDRADALLGRYVRALETLTTARRSGDVRVDVDTERRPVARVNDEVTAVAQTDHWSSVDARLARTALRTPDVTALVGTDLTGRSVTLTLGEVESRVASLATLIVERTASPESVVALAMPRTVEHVIAIFATLRAGCTYLPLDTSNPPGRLRRLAARAGADLVLTTPDVAGPARLAEVAPVLLPNDPDLTEALAGRRPATPLPAVHPDQAAYLIYTSGSTGEPKAVVVPHRGLATMHDNHVAAIFEPALRRAGRARFVVAHTVSFSFDMSWEEFFWLMDGHEVHVIDEALRLDVPRLVAHYREIGVDVVNVTPSYGRELITAGLLDDAAPHLVLLGGEAVPPHLWTLLRDHPTSRGYDLYGPTEFTINALGADLQMASEPCLGRPVARSQAYVLDSSLAEVPPGGTGELYLAGDGLTRGYLAAPAMTAERYVANPYGPSGSRLYRTGDRVGRRVDGGIEYRGRNDAQLKLRGFRIELGEVEAVAEEHPSVHQACASVHCTASGIDVLRLHVVTLDGSVPDDLGTHLAATLPGHAVPRQIGAVDAIPLTTNGKVDRGALPDLDHEIRHDPPRTAVETILCQIMTEVLGVAVTGRDDSFFDLGGHSLAAMRVVARIAEELGTDVRVGTLMAAQTVAGLAAAMAAPSAEAGLAPDLVLQAPTARPTVFCVHPAGGFAWQFAPLVAYVRTGVIGLQSVELSGGSSTARTVRDLAEEYLVRVRRHQPHGPYRLLGYSFGGNVAHEVAARLVASGETVELLGLLDPRPLSGRDVVLDDDQVRTVRDEQTAFMAAVTATRGLAARDEAVAAIRASVGVLGDGVDPGIVEAIVAAHRSAAVLMGASTSPQTSVPTLLIVSGLDGGPATVWGDLLGDEVEVHTLAVSHDELVTPAQWKVLGPIVARRLGEHRDDDV